MKAAFVFILFLLPFLAKAERWREERAKNLNILYINSYDQRMKWSRDILDEVFKRLAPDENNITLHIRNLDAKRFPPTQGESYIEKYKDIIQLINKIDNPIDIILTSDDHAYNLIKEFRDKNATRKIYHVFCGANQYPDKKSAEKQDEDPYAHGVLEAIPRHRNLELIRKFSDSKVIYLICDGVFDRSFVNSITRET